MTDVSNGNNQSSPYSSEELAFLVGLQQYCLGLPASDKQMVPTLEGFAPTGYNEGREVGIPQFSYSNEEIPDREFKSPNTPAPGDPFDGNADSSYPPSDLPSGSAASTTVGEPGQSITAQTAFIRFLPNTFERLLESAKTTLAFPGLGTIGPVSPQASRFISITKYSSADDTMGTLFRVTTFGHTSMPALDLSSSVPDILPVSISGIFEEDADSPSDGSDDSDGSNTDNEA